MHNRMYTAIQRIHSLNNNDDNKSKKVYNILLKNIRQKTIKILREEKTEELSDKGPHI